MKDLEHDLRELFDRRVRDVDAPGLAPKTVLKRGRRRQVGTVATGVLACVVALGVAAVAIGQARHPAIIPGGNGLPERTTSVGGVPVTAPAGWSLVDDFPLAAILATTSQTCSFTATGAAVDGNGSPIDASPSPSPVGSSADGGASSGPSCSQESGALDTSVPIIQLANFTVPLTGALCKTDLGRPTGLPTDGVAVYVGAFPAGSTPGSILSSCPSASTVAFGSLSGSPGAVLAAVAIEGPDASGTDDAVAKDFVNAFDPSAVTTPTPTDGVGPGYVVATGASGAQSWRLEAGITSLDAGDGTPHLGSLMYASTISGDEVGTVALPAHQRVGDDSVDLGNGHVVQFGTATADVTDISVDLATGDSVPATMFAWPAPSAFPGLPIQDGWVWFVEATQRGLVRASFPSVPTTTPTASETGQADQLNTRQTADGQTVIYGHDLGHDWEIRHRDGAVEFFVDGAQDPAQAMSFAMGTETQIDVDGGTFLLAVLDPTVRTLTITTDATDAQPSTTIAGRWAPAQDNAGDQARIWLVPLPGSGTGTEQLNDALPSFDAWPTQPLHQGSSFSSMSDGTVAWTLRYQNDRCVQLVTLGADSGNSGASQCLPPWQDLGSDPLVSGVYGSTRATVAVVVTHRPATSVTSRDLNKGELQCVDVDVESNFAGTTFCVFPVEVGHSVTLDLAQSGGPSNLNQPITVTARSGSIELAQSGSATSAPSP